MANVIRASFGTRALTIDPSNSFVLMSYEADIGTRIRSEFEPAHSLLHAPHMRRVSATRVSIARNGARGKGKGWTTMEMGIELKLVPIRIDRKEANDKGTRGRGEVGIHFGLVSRVGCCME